MWMALAIALVLAMGCVSSDSKPVKVGALLALTGSIADQGRWVQNGLELAEEKINAENGINGRPIELRVEDVRADPKEALNAYLRLRSVDDARFMITMGSGVGLALTAPGNADRVIQIGVATATPDYSTTDDYTFRVFETATQEMKGLAGLVRQRFGYEKVAVLWIQNDYGKGVKDAFASEWTKAGGSVVLSESFLPDSTDFRSILEKLPSVSPDAVFVVAYTKDGGRVLKQMRERGFSYPVFGSQAILGGNEFFDIAGDSAEGLLIAAPVLGLDSDNARAQEFVADYRKRFGQEPEIYSARAFDALMVLAEAMKKCADPTDTDCVKDQLYGSPAYAGASGTVKFDRNGDIGREFGLRWIKDRNIVPFDAAGD
jgi:branched-chain amino acid transport system substrate-binding protein